MITDENTYLSQEKCDELTKELEHLKTVRRREIAEQLEYARSLGDLSENAEYHEARENQASIEDRIAKLENILKTTVILSGEATGKADVGSTVVIQKTSDKSEAKYKIVGSEEANIKQGKLSINSPLGSSILGKKKGEAVSVKTPGGMMEYKIVKIE